MPFQADATTHAGPARPSNVRIALILGGVALLLFLVTLWQFRPN